MAELEWRCLVDVFLRNTTSIATVNRAINLNFPDAINAVLFLGVLPEVPPEEQLGALVPTCVDLVRREIAAFFGVLQADEVTTLDEGLSWKLLLVTAVQQQLKSRILVMGEERFVPLAIIRDITDVGWPVWALKPQ